MIINIIDQVEETDDVLEVFNRVYLVPAIAPYVKNMFVVQTATEYIRLSVTGSVFVVEEIIPVEYITMQPVELSEFFGINPKRLPNSDHLLKIYEMINRQNIVNKKDYEIMLKETHLPIVYDKNTGEAYKVYEVIKFKDYENLKYIYGVSTDRDVISIDINNDNVCFIDSSIDIVTERDCVIFTDGKPKTVQMKTPIEGIGTFTISNGNDLIDLIKVKEY